MGAVLTKIAKRAPGLVVLWILALMLFVLIVVLYIIQNSHIDKPEAIIRTRNLSNAMGGVGIALCVTGGIWLLLLVRLVSDTSNVWTDASSIYVSRHNLLLNWFVKTPPNGPPITGNTKAGDATECFKDFGKADDPAAYDGYRAFIKEYEGANTVNQTYEHWQPGQPPYQQSEDLLTQQKLSLAYYRYYYCTKSYFQDILNGDFDKITFLPQATIAKLKSKTSNCNTGVPDTQACKTGGPPGTRDCGVNECFTALNQSIAAQCLLYDDHTYNVINSSGPKGVIEAFELGATSRNAYGVNGYQVLAPP